MCIRDRFLSFDLLSNSNTRSPVSSDFCSKDLSSSKKLLLNELHQKLNEALSRLSDKHRTIVVLFEIDGLSHKEISEIMKCTEGTVRSRLYYAKQQLQAFLSDYISS